MALANDMTDLVNKIERRLGLMLLTPHLPERFNKEAWAKVIKEDTMVTFSRYFPLKVPFIINKETCNKRKEGNKWVYYIKDEYLGDGIKLLGASDIDWSDTSVNNSGLGQMSGYGYYIPNYGTIDATFEAFIGKQIAADFASLYNNQIYVDFQYPNKLSLVRSNGLNLNMESFAVNLLINHTTLATISPTKMEAFESLAQADVANFLYMNLRFFDNLETIYANIDLKMGELDQERNKRETIIEELKNSYVSASNDAIPYIMTLNG